MLLLKFKQIKKNIFSEILEKVRQKTYYSKEIKIQKLKYYTIDKGKKSIIKKDLDGKDQK